MCSASAISIRSYAFGLLYERGGIHHVCLRILPQIYSTSLYLAKWRFQTFKVKCLHSVRPCFGGHSSLAPKRRQTLTLPLPLPNDIFSRTKKDFRWQRLKSGGETEVGDITFERRDDRSSPPPQLLPIENFFPICQREQISNVNSSVVVFVRWADGSDSSSDAISKLPFKHLSFGSNTSNCAEELSFFK